MKNLNTIYSVLNKCGSNKDLHVKVSPWCTACIATGNRLLRFKNEFKGYKYHVPCLAFTICWFASCFHRNPGKNTIRLLKLFALTQLFIKVVLVKKSYICN